MKQCKECGEFKPYNQHAKRQSKEQGFVGKVCWDCFVVAQRLNMQARTTRKDPQSRTYGALVLKVQSALDKLSTMPSSPSLEHQRQALEYDLEKAKFKATKFGPNAYDYTPAELRKATKKANPDND